MLRLIFLSVFICKICGEAKVFTTDGHRSAQMPYIIYNSSIQSLSAYNPQKDKEKINEVIFYLCSSVNICGSKNQTLISLSPLPRQKMRAGYLLLKGT